MSSKRENVFYQAQDILSRRDHSEHEVRQKLFKKGFSVEDIDEAITQLKERKYLDDARFAEAFVRNALMMRPVGPRWLILKLQEKRIATELIEPAVYGQLDSDKEEQLAQEAAEKWARTKKTADPEKNRQRLLRHLISRGFDYEISQNALEEALAKDL